MADNDLIIYDEDDLKSKIYIIKGAQVMLDFDLAKIYGYETKNFNRQVKIILSVLMKISAFN